ncbi:VAMP-associated protein [Eremomyces bilateralis CBS 781.70]|uniref:VAMP-associated protein n=1 Tax=Eremomyces bilateralis CBS 781.70 TaxID=1392243 RepID=A0A6G1FZ07_9PEZI|nr:VAMP-associated protein [Eremomyces bilateralis CBS 781.70]KAF1811105.1 VAMP-associated protein [Eremomyces bilateralis CBS 781.70]
MSVELDPSELSFKRPFDHEVSQILSLRNPHDDPVAFKVKTTAPKQYCVRPNSGRIDPGGTVEVQVLLQSMQKDPPADFKCRDKFLVQSVGIAKDTDVSNVASIWSQIEQTAKSTIQERKIRVVFLPADGDAPTSTPAKAPNGIKDELSSSQSILPITPGTSRANSTARSEPLSTPTTSDKSKESKPIPTAISEKANATYAELKQQLAAANEQILKLKEQAQEGLRQRKPTSQETKSTGAGGAGNLATANRNPPQNGVPLQITALLCLLSFLLGWWLF